MTQKLAGVAEVAYSPVGRRLIQLTERCQLGTRRLKLTNNVKNYLAAISWLTWRRSGARAVHMRGQAQTTLEPACKDATI